MTGLTATNKDSWLRRKWHRLGLGLVCALAAGALSCSTAPDRPPVVVLGVDGASWDLIFQYSRSGRMPHLAKLIGRGSGGYVNSLLWQRFTHRRRGYFSPIVWTSIATGKRPDQHGIEDFVLPRPEDRDFYLLGGGGAGVLDVQLLQAGSLLIEGSSMLPDSAVTLDVRLDGQSVGQLSFPGSGSVQTLAWPADRLPAGRARLELSVTPPGTKVPALRVRRLGYLDSAGRLLRWLHPRQNQAEMQGAWHWPPQLSGVPTAAYHRWARPVWDIASASGRQVAVVGWWGSAPAQPVKGTLVSDWAGIRNKVADADVVYPPELASTVQKTQDEVTGLMEVWHKELADALDCPCLGSRQRQVYLLHRYEDELRLRLAEHLAADRPQLMMVYLRLIDAASHQFLAFERAEERDRCRQPGCNADRLGELVPGSYDLLDEAVGRLMKVVPENAVWLLVSDHGQVSQENQPGQHQNNGFILLAGPGIRSGLLFEAQVTDVAPTVLYLLGLPIGSDMPGRLLTSALEPDRLQRQPPQWVVSHEDLLKPLPDLATKVDSKVADEQMEQIEALGYLE